MLRSTAELTALFAPRITPGFSKRLIHKGNNLQCECTGTVRSNAALRGVTADLAVREGHWWAGICTEIAPSSCMRMDYWLKSQLVIALTPPDNQRLSLQTHAFPAIKGKTGSTSETQQFGGFCVSGRCFVVVNAQADAPESPDAKADQITPSGEMSRQSDKGKARDQHSPPPQSIVRPEAPQ